MIRAYLGFDHLEHRQHLADGNLLDVHTYPGNGTLVVADGDGRRSFRLCGNGFAAEIRPRFTNGAITNGRFIMHFRARRGTGTEAVLREGIVPVTAGLTAPFRVHCDANGRMEIRRDSTSLIIWNDALSTSWSHFILDVVIHDSNGSATLYRDGAVFGSPLTGANTQHVTGDLVAVRIGGISSGAGVNSTTGFGWWLRDIVIEDANVLGPVAVLPHPVSSDVGTPEWDPDSGTDVYPMLEDIPMDAGTKATSDTVEQKTRHGITASGLAGRDIFSVRTLSGLSLAAEGPDKCTLRLGSGAASDLEEEVTPTTDVGVFVGPQADEDPDTSAAWTEGGVGSVELEMEHT